MFMRRHYRTISIVIMWFYDQFSLPITETFRHPFWIFRSEVRSFGLVFFCKERGRGVWVTSCQVLSVLMKSCVVHGFFFNLSTSLTRDYKTFIVVLQHGTTVRLRGGWPAYPYRWPGVWTSENLKFECFCTSRLVSGWRIGTDGACYLSSWPVYYSFLACPGRE